jgi:hypothetical protein
MQDTIFDSEQKRESYRDINNGGASIISPRGTYLAEPVLNKEMIVYADIDLEMIIDAKWASDCIGHYARPDVTKLLINDEKYSVYESTQFSSNFADRENYMRLEDDLQKLSDEIEKSHNKTLQKLFTNFLRDYF